MVLKLNQTRNGEISECSALHVSVTSATKRQSWLVQQSQTDLYTEPAPMNVCSTAIAGPQ